jgi:DNA-binding response OmpR family regulator
MAAGYDSFFVKPIDIEALVETVAAVARRTSPTGPSTPATQL